MTLAQTKKSNIVIAIGAKQFNKPTKQRRRRPIAKNSSDHCQTWPLPPQTRSKGHRTNHRNLTTSRTMHWILVNCPRVAGLSWSTTKSTRTVYTMQRYPSKRQPRPPKRYPTQWARATETTEIQQWHRRHDKPTTATTSTWQPRTMKIGTENLDAHNATIP